MLGEKESFKACAVLKFWINPMNFQASAKIQDLQIKLTSAEEEVRSLQLKHEFEIEVEKNAKKCLQREKDGLENDLHISKQEIIALKSTVAKMTADSLGISTELQATKVSLV